MSSFSHPRLRRLSDAMRGYVDQAYSPGIVTLVSRRGETYVDFHGNTTFEGDAPMRRDTIFRISSLTKPITAVAAMILVEECKLRLDEPVDGLLPELADRKVLRSLESPVDDTVPANRSITVRDLLTFRCGYGLVMAWPGTYPIQDAMDKAGIGNGPPAPASLPEPDEWMRRLGTLPLIHQPGERWMYNTGADILGMLIARASGQPFDQFLRERLFEPLGMVDTSFSVPAEKMDRFAPVYWNDFSTGDVAEYDAVDGQWSTPPAFPSGGGGLVSTIDDYFAFGRMLMNLGKLGDVRILSRPSVELMTSDQLTPGQKAISGLVGGFFDSHGWGFGMATVNQRERLGASPGAYFWDGGFGTSWQNDPAEDLIGLIFTQRLWTSPSPPNIVRDFWALTYQAIDD